MARKKHKQTPAEAAAGQANLQKWLADHPSRGNLRHGGYSRLMRRKFEDKRTGFGRQLSRIMGDLVIDLGGQAALGSAQRLLLENIRSKLIVLLQISKYISTQESIISESGELLPCLGRNYTTYSESLRRDLEALFQLKRKPAQLPYEKIIRSLEGPGE